ncbi:MAG: galactose-1-phosphate uridylyltransferase [Granulosicoccus sp.]|nr:galactose-1-phosphate uridylyltransferase [Granulosicoccus sp.]
MRTRKTGNWERRWHPLLSQWVLISARSAARPWSGAKLADHQQAVLQHDPDCYLCPRVTRANGQVNPDYQGAYAFDNDFPSLSFDAPDDASTSNENELHRTAPAHGRCRVLCWSERHDATLASLDTHRMQAVVRLWQTEYQSLCLQTGIENVLIFENKGVEIGVSNLHPHGQIYATSFVTDSASRMRDAQATHAREHGGESLLQNLLHDAHTQAHLMVEKRRWFSVIVPFAARFSYESWIVPNRHVSSLADMQDEELDELAVLYQRQVRRYDLLFQRSAPNITLLHNAPCDVAHQADNLHWCFHLVFQPPLRDPEKLKYLAGFESGSNNIVNPVQPEQAAEQLRSIDPDRWSS